MRYLILQDKNNYKFCYKIADSTYLSDIQINGLDYLLQPNFNFLGKQFHLDKNLKTLPATKKQFKNSLFNDLTPIGDNEYQIQILTNHSDYLVYIQSDVYQIEKSTITANILEIDITILMGPVFILQLAKNLVFCLHASAFIIDKTCFILMADSGTGKSTIARHIQKSRTGQRIADDIVPIKIIDDKITVLPNFPQLKLSQKQQYIGENICLNTVLLFTEKSKCKTSLQILDSFVAIKRLVKHSVATKLFADIELQNHLKFCHQASQQTKAYQLDYQHSEHSLLQLQELLDEIA